MFSVSVQITGKFNNFKPRLDYIAVIRSASFKCAQYHIRYSELSDVKIIVVPGRICNRITITIVMIMITSNTKLDPIT